MQKLYFFILCVCFLGDKLYAQQNFELKSSPVVTSLSIDPSTSKVILSWGQAPSGEVVDFYDISEMSYFLGANLSFKQPPSASVSGTQHSIVRSPDLSTGTQWSYRLRARNSENISPLSPAFVIMNLFGNYNYCSNEILLGWRPYQMLAIDNSSGKVKDDKDANEFNADIQYQVWGYKGVGPFDINLAGPLTVKSKQNLDVKIGNIEINSTYFLYVKAFLPNGETATSMLLTVPTKNKSLPQIMAIDSVVSSGGNINLHINLDRTSELDTFALYRSNDYRPIQWYYNINDVPTNYRDSRGISLGEVYSYRLAAFRCSRPIMESDSAQNILLFSRSQGQDVRVQWSMVNGDSPSYTLMRDDWINAIDVSGNHDLIFLDEAADYLCNGSHDFCYKIIADNGVTVSISETTCTTLFPMVNIPNAIDPSGSGIMSNVELKCTGQVGFSRNLFGPIIDMHPNAYGAILEIFDRSGIRLFASKKNYGDSQLQFWDGTYNGSFVDEGVYVYSIRVAMDNKEPLTFRGTVTVAYHR